MFTPRVKGHIGRGILPTSVEEDDHHFMEGTEKGVIYMEESPRLRFWKIYPVKISTQLVQGGQDLNERESN